MGAVLSKMDKNQKPEYHSLSSTYVFKRRVYEVRSPCQWLTNCSDGKCPSFQRINGNFYCVRKEIP
jgi:hypothetical protein